MSRIDEKLEQLGITLPQAPSPIGSYVPAVRVGNLLYLSGLGPGLRDDGSAWAGKVGANYTLEEGNEAARSTGISIIARMKGHLGDLDKVKQVVKVLGMVNSAPGFNQQPAVINGCSDLFGEVFGEAGRHARSAVGMAGLPNDIPVEIEVIVEVGD